MFEEQLIAVCEDGVFCFWKEFPGDGSLPAATDCQFDFGMGETESRSNLFCYFFRPVFS